MTQKIDGKIKSLNSSATLLIRLVWRRANDKKYYKLKDWFFN